MATLTIRKLDDEVYERLRARALRNDRSIEAEARHMLGGVLGADKAKITDEAERAAYITALIERLRLNALPVEPGMDSVSLIRAVRDEE